MDENDTEYDEMEGDGLVEDGHFDASNYHPNTRSTLGSIPQVADVSQIEAISSIQSILSTWNQNYQKPNYDPLPTLNQIAALLEKATVEHLKSDPDPLDDRHPVRTHPYSTFGNLLKILFRNEDFMTKLVVSYLLGRDNIPLNIAAARILLDCVPGLDSSAVFSEPDDFVPTMYQWAEHSESEELQAYAMGLLSAAMEVQDNASKYRDQNGHLIPIALNRLKRLKEKMFADREKAKNEKITVGETNQADAQQQQQQPQHEKDGESSRESGKDDDDGPFANVDLNAPAPAPGSNDVVLQANGEEQRTPYERPRSASIRVRPSAVVQPTTEADGAVEQSPPRKRRRSARGGTDRKKSVSAAPPPPQELLANGEESSSNWHLIEPMLIGKHQVYPLTIEMHQRLILQYLCPTGEYQDLLAKAYEGDAMSILFDYLDVKKTQDVRFTFDASRYVASLLVHRKFAMEFVARGGVETLLRIPYHCLAAVGAVTCFYYLAYSDDVMERVCQLSEKTIDAVVDYALWCIEHSHESGMASATMFFTHGLCFRAILDRFDQRDGLRKMFNYVNTLTVLQNAQVEEDVNERELTDEQMHTTTQSIRNASAAFRSYAAAHVFVKMEQLRKAGKGAVPHGYGCTFPAAISQNTPSFRPMTLDFDGLQACVWTLSCALRGSGSAAQWRAGDEMRRIGLARLMFIIIMTVDVWETATGRTEALRNAIEVIWIICASPRAQICLMNQVQIKDHFTCPMLGHLIDFCNGEDSYASGHPDFQYAALQIILNCVCTPSMIDQKATATTVAAKNGAGERKIIKTIPPRDVLERMWDSVRKCNGLMNILKVLRATTPANDADRLRATAVKILLGMSRDPDLRQIISKMTLITQNELHVMMREPISSSQRAVHSRFCKDARKLIETVTQKPVRDPKDVTQERLWRQFIVNSTKITYNDMELLQLIYSHLMKKGLKGAAQQLASEANLPSVPARLVPSTPAKIAPLPNIRKFFSRSAATKSSLSLEASQSQIGPRFVQHLSTPSASISSLTQSTSGSSSIDEMVVDAAPAVTATSQAAPVFATPTRPALRRVSQFPHLTLRTPAAQTPHTPGLSSAEPAESIENPPTNLDDIVTSYFRVQHSECKNPVSTVPPFSLFKPHHCPETSNASSIADHIVSRQYRRSLSVRNKSRLYRADERFVFSRFRPLKQFMEHDEVYTAATFSVDDEHVIVGMYTGDVYWLNVETVLEESHTQCHHSAITNIEQSSDGSLLLTSSAYMVPFSSLWRLGETQEHMLDFANETYVEFAHRTLDKVIGTTMQKEACATLFDVESGQPIVKLYQPELDMRYSRNQAHFSPDDTVVLHDGRLWDVRQGAKMLHSFDRLNDAISGVFHPHGNEVIINSEVWDVRTYRLLYSIPSLDQTQLTFNSTGNIMYAITHADKNAGEDFRDLFKGTFSTYDATTYELLHTVDVKKPLLGLCADHADHYMAVIEKTSPDHDDVADFMNQDSSAVKLYEVGKLRVAEEDLDEGEEEGEEGDEDNDDDGSDGMDDDESFSSSDSDSEDIDLGDSDDNDDDNDDGDDEESVEAEESEGELSDGWELEEDSRQAQESLEAEGGEGESMEGQEGAEGESLYADQSPENTVEEQGAEDESEDDQDNQEDDQEMSDDSDSEDDSEEDAFLLEAEEMEDEDDETFHAEETEDNRGQGTSTIVLNPNLRRQRRREGGNGGSGGPGGSSQA